MHQPLHDKYPNAEIFNAIFPFTVIEWRVLLSVDVSKNTWFLQSFDEIFSRNTELVFHRLSFTWKCLEVYTYENIFKYIQVYASTYMNVNCK